MKEERTKETALPQTYILLPFRRIAYIFGNAAFKFYSDDGFSRAASLSYAMLFALVPATYLTVTMLHLIGAGESEVRELVERVINQLLPSVEAGALHDLRVQLFEYLGMFQKNVKALNFLSTATLILTSVTLISSIQAALNYVWRVTPRTSLVTRFTSYWTLITVGPIALFLSFYLPSQLGNLVQSQGWADLKVLTFLSVGLPLLVVWFALSGAFFSLPAARVSIKAAALGGLVGAVLLEIVKMVFAQYLKLATTYSAIYGVLAAIPLFLLWMYLAWCVILYGAEVAYQTGSMHVLRGLKRYATALGEVGAIVGVRILTEIGSNFAKGEGPPTESELAVSLSTDPVLVRACLDVLTESGLLAAVDEKTMTRSLLRAPGKIEIKEVFRIFCERESFSLGLEEKQSDDEKLFLDYWRTAALSLGAEREMSTWTLMEFIEAGEFTSVRK